MAFPIRRYDWCINRTFYFFGGCLMTFDSGTWLLILGIVGIVIGALTFLLKRSIFGRMDEIKNSNAEAIRNAQEDIKKIRVDYTPRADHRTDIEELREDIKKMKENFLTKEDFFREQSKTDRKLDDIMKILLGMKGEGK